MKALVNFIEIPLTPSVIKKMQYFKNKYNLWSIPARNSIAAQVRGPDRTIGKLLLLSATLLVFSWFVPVMTVSRLVFLEDAISIFDGLVTLALHRELFLLTIVFIFSILFPTLKLILAYLLWCRADISDANFATRLSRIQSLGKWSMTDVFLVAIIVASVKVSFISDVHLHWGLYTFSASILLSMLALARLTILAHRLQTNA